MLDYVLLENLLTQLDLGDYRAQVVNVVSKTQKEIIDRIMHIGAGVIRSDITSILEAYKQVICEIVEEGGAVTTELFNIFPSISGVFTSITDSYDPAHHHVHANLHAGIALREARLKVKPKKVSGGLIELSVLAVTDVNTGSLNNLLTPNRNLHIAGQKIKIAGDKTPPLAFPLSARTIPKPSSPCRRRIL
jgi:hypothetical protein